MYGQELREPTIDLQQRVNGKYHFNENNRNTSHHCINFLHTPLVDIFGVGSGHKILKHVYQATLREIQC